MRPLAECLPDASDAVLVGRVWDGVTDGPRLVVVHAGRVADVTPAFRSMSDLLDAPDPATAALDAAADGAECWSLDRLHGVSGDAPDDGAVLSPFDLQVVKACGVTFVASMLERTIEEAAGGDPARATELRRRIGARVERGLDTIVPGSPDAIGLKQTLITEGLWSQYLEVGIGPDPEVFTKAPVLSSVGWGARVGVSAASGWNNPEPEVVLAVDSRGGIRGATLGNDVNLRDIEGRSALLLGKAKDNNASCAIGPFIRLFTDGFTIDDLRTARIELTIEGEDGFALHESGDLTGLGRPFEALVAATAGAHHQYPDGFALFTGTPFAPTQDRDTPGLGFTHHPGDRVEIASPLLGRLVNTTAIAEQLPPWSYGIRRLGEYWETMNSDAHAPKGHGAI